MPAYFVTGTDTDAGKTLISTGLLALARRQGLTTLGLKPVASGSTPTPAGLRNADALALQAQSVPGVNYQSVNPFVFAPAIAPHLAAHHAGMTLRLTDLESRLRPLLIAPRELTLIEGAGGWRVPLNDDEELSGIATRLQLPVILVAGLKLGCISHARLAAEAILADGLHLAGWAGSLIDPTFADNIALYHDNLAVLKRYLPAPCLGVVPHLAASTPAAMAKLAADHLTLPSITPPLLTSAWRP